MSDMHKWSFYKDDNRGRIFFSVRDFIMTVNFSGNWRFSLTTHNNDISVIDQYQLHWSGFSEYMTNKWTFNLKNLYVNAGKVKFQVCVLQAFHSKHSDLLK